MSRRILALLVALGLTAPASAQGLTTFFATGPKDGGLSSVAFSFHHLSTDPAVLALTQFNVLGANPGAATVTNLTSGDPLPVADISPANPFLLSLTGGAVLGGGNLSTEALTLYPSLGFGGPSGGSPTGPVPLLSVLLTQPEGGKAGSLSYTVSDANGDLGGATLAIPFGGWWVLGFGSANQPVLDPLPVDPIPVPVDPLAPTAGPNGPAPTPEPATLLLAGIGLAGAAVMRKRRGRVN